MPGPVGESSRTMPKPGRSGTGPPALARGPRRGPQLRHRLRRLPPPTNCARLSLDKVIDALGGTRLVKTQQGQVEADTKIERDDPAGRKIVADPRSRPRPPVRRPLPTPTALHRLCTLMLAGKSACATPREARGLLRLLSLHRRQALSAASVARTTTVLLMFSLREVEVAYPLFSRRVGTSPSREASSQGTVCVPL